MALHYLHNWSQYLSDEDYEYLIQYVENIKNNVPNHEMIILFGPERSGKTTLKRDIADYLGDDLCGNLPYTDKAGDIIYQETIKRLGFVCAIDEVYRSRKNNIAFINFIKYKQSFIADTLHIERVNYKLLEHCRVIRLDHVF